MRTVVVDGQVVVADGTLVTADDARSAVACAHWRAISGAFVAEPPPNEHRCRPGQSLTAPFRCVRAVGKRLRRGFMSPSLSGAAEHPPKTRATCLQRAVNRMSDRR